jgi:hypothetical protein
MKLIRKKNSLVKALDNLPKGVEIKNNGRLNYSGSGYIEG